MFPRRYGSFAGGIDLPDEKHATLGRAIEACQRPQLLRVPLAAWPLKPARLLVSRGQSVSAHERLAGGVDGAVDVFAPLAGVVGQVVPVELAGTDGFVTAAAVELLDVSAPKAPAPLSAGFDWRSAQPAELRRRLGGGGLTTFRRPLECLAGWVERARRRGCRWLVANAMENQPYLTAAHRLLAEHGMEVVRGLAILARAMEVRETMLAVDARRTGEYVPLVGASRMYQITRVALPHKYPTGADAMLLKVLLRREMPPGGGSFDVSAAVVDAAACQAVWRWVACGVPATGRVVTAAGPLCDQPGNYWTPFGTPCRRLAGGEDAMVVHGGPMTGLACPPGAVIGPGSDAVLALPRSDAPRAGACIHCGWCTDYCPARLNVSALNDHFELGLLDRAERAGALACVGCGVCSYVCPSRLPLSRRVGQLKRALRPVRAEAGEVAP